MITPENYRCWIIDRLPGAAEPHFKTKAAAVADLRLLRKHDEDRAADAVARQLDAPCWTIRCDGECGYVLDEDEDGLVHFLSADEALRTVRDWEWRLIDHEHVLCPDDALAPPSPAQQEAAGQLRFPGVLT